MASRTSKSRADSLRQATQKMLTRERGELQNNDTFIAAMGKIMNATKLVGGNHALRSLLMERSHAGDVGLSKSDFLAIIQRAVGDMRDANAVVSKAHLNAIFKAFQPDAHDRIRASAIITWIDDTSTSHYVHAPKDADPDIKAGKLVLRKKALAAEIVELAEEEAKLKETLKALEDKRESIRKRAYDHELGLYNYRQKTSKRNAMQKKEKQHKEKELSELIARCKDVLSKREAEVASDCQKARDETQKRISLIEAEIRETLNERQMLLDAAPNARAATRLAQQETIRAFQKLKTVETSLNAHRQHKLHSLLEMSFTKHEKKVKQLRHIIAHSQAERKASEASLIQAVANRNIMVDELVRHGIPIPPELRDMDATKASSQAQQDSQQKEGGHGLSTEQFRLASDITDKIFARLKVEGTVKPRPRKNITIDASTPGTEVSRLPKTPHPKSAPPATANWKGALHL
eukprot:g2479.t1